MKTSLGAICVLLAAAWTTPARTLDAPHPAETVSRSVGGLQLAQRARSCKQVSSCREAVEIWCDGYRRADGDGDGIPCENVCPSKELVDEIREEIGC